jgi:hypothetical protein
MYLRRVRRRIEALEKAAKRHRQRTALAQIQNRALDTLSDDQLEAFVRWLRFITAGGEPDDAGSDACEAFYAALEREQAASGWPETNRSTGGVGCKPIANP